MPSGYTSQLYEGKVEQTFEDFVLLGARGMGACIMQREESLANPPRLERASSHYERKIEEARAEIVRLRQLTDESADAQSKKEHAEAVERRERSDRENEARRKRYVEMQSKVADWVPPTKDHQGLKDFLLDQLKQSIEWDCHKSMPLDPPLSGREWKNRRLQQLIKDVAFYEKEHAEDLARVAARNAWIEALYASFGRVPRSAPGPEEER